MNQELLKALDEIQIDPKSKSPANIMYVKARIAIEQFAKNREERRMAKQQVVALLNGSINNHQIRPGVTKHKVVFGDGTVACL